MTELNATSAALLGLLHDGPATGGQLVATARGTYGPFFSVTRSQVYRELPALADEGLLRLGKQGARASQQYVITASGKRAFKRWLTTTSGPDHLRSTVLLRVVHASSVTDKQRATLLEAARAYYTAQLDDGKAAARMAESPAAKAIAQFAQSYARAALKLVDSIADSADA